RELTHELVQQLIVCGDAAAGSRELATLSQFEGESFRVRTYRIDLYRLDGRLDQALEAMEQVFPEVSDRSQACLRRGIIYLDLGRYSEAAGDLERAVAAQPRNASAHFKLSEAYRGLAHEEPARRHREVSAATEEQRSRIE